jgi:hypothetical protein
MPGFGVLTSVIPSAKYQIYTKEGVVNTQGLSEDAYFVSDYTVLSSDGKTQTVMHVYFDKQKKILG